MSVVKIISGSLPTQTTMFNLGSLVVTTTEGGSRAYRMEQAIIKLNKVSENKGNVVFEIELRDGNRFKGDTDTKTFHQFTKYEGASTGLPYITQELTPEEKKKREKTIGVSILIFIIVIIGLAAMPDDTSKNNTTEKRPETGLYIMSDKTFGCLSKSYLNNLHNFVAQEDRLAFGKALTSGLSLDLCTMFKKGAPVYLIKAGLLKSKIRRKGDMTEYWVSSESLK